DQETMEFQRLLGSATGFMIEPIGLFTFSHLGLTHKLGEVGDIYVAQRAFDLLHELEAKRTVTQRATSEMGMIDGQFFMQEFTAAEIEKINSALRIATKWVEQNANSIGLAEPLNADDTKWERVLGIANLATVVTAKQRGLVLITDDKTLGDIAQQNF